MIYTNDEDSIPLANVFEAMKNVIDTTPPADPNGKDVDVRTYFKAALPNFDDDRVTTGDIRKVIKWFNFLNNRNQLIEQENTATEEEATAEETPAAVVEEAPAAEPAKKPRAKKTKE
jgi:hypothetical protein